MEAPVSGTNTQGHKIYTGSASLKRKFVSL